MQACLISIPEHSGLHYDFQFTMAPDERNNFLDADESEDELSHGYDSEEDLRKGGRGAKRRKIEENESDEDAFSEEEEQKEESADGKDKLPVSRQEKSAGSIADANQGGKEKPRKPPKDNAAVLSAPAKPVGTKNLVATESQIKKSGVVYLSRIPPFMKPSKLRSLLEPYGKINRTFLSPEDPAARARRLRSGGNKKQLYTDGWVEFVRKKDAKDACDLLNARPIGGKKGTYYRDDVWSMLYLKAFKWHNLTEQIAAENAERESRMRAEIAKTNKENKEFVRNVERAKMLDGIEAKSAAKKRRLSDQGGDGPSKETREDAAGTGGRERKRTFNQVPLVKKRNAEDQPEQVTRVLSKIF